MSNWTLYGYGYAMGQYFHMKYVVLYGISTSIAKFDGISAPNTPKCIGRIHLYSNMWKYFDCGLYKFLLKYIYIPCSKNKLSMTNKMFSSFLCFCYVYIWHGMQNFILIWSFLNFVSIMLETGSKFFYAKYFQRELEANLSYSWRRRLTCLICSPLLTLSAVSNFFFFAGTQIGLLFFERILKGTKTIKTKFNLQLFIFRFFL